MPTRRTLLGSIGATGAVVLAGCLGGGDESDDGDGGPENEQSDENSTSQDDEGENDDDQDDNSGIDPADVPGEEEAKAIVDAYLLAVSNGNPELFTEVVHPDSPLAGTFSDEDIEETGQYLNYYYQNMTVAELNREEAYAIVEYDLAVETSDDQRTTESTQELRVHDGQWKIWLTVPPEGGEDDNNE